MGATAVAAVCKLVQAGHGAPGADAAWWSLALGADLGGNATAVGASANVVILGIAARYGHPITFWTLTKHGLVVASTSLVIAWATSPCTPSPSPEERMACGAPRRRR